MKELLLRPFTRQEVSIYQSCMASKDMVGPHVQTESDSLEELLNDFDKSGWKGPDLYRWLYVDPDDRIYGFAHCWPCDRYEKHIEFGRILFPEYRGKSLGVPFLKTILRTIFDTIDTNRVQAITSCNNEVVTRHWREVGIQIEGRLRQFMTIRDAQVDCYLGAILRQEWSQMN